MLVTQPLAAHGSPGPGNGTHLRCSTLQYSVRCKQPSASRSGLQAAPESACLKHVCVSGSQAYPVGHAEEDAVQEAPAATLAVQMSSEPLQNASSAQILSAHESPMAATPPPSLQAP